MNKNYLKEELLTRNPQTQSNLRSHKTIYNLMRSKRFLLQTVMIFVFQFLVIINMNISYPIAPLYPPMGIAFVVFYLLGNSAFWGLFLAGCSAYFLKGMPIDAFCLYLIADILGGYVGATLSWRILSLDIRPFMHKAECFKFLLMNALTACIISSVLRIIPFIRHSDSYTRHSDSHFLIILYNFIDLWLADLNAILVMSIFLLSWAYLSFSREKITTEKFPIVIAIFVIGFIILSVLYLSSTSFIFVLTASMLITMLLASLYGYLVATALLFVVSSIYFTFFMAHLPQFLMHFGIGHYTLIPLALLSYILIIIFLGHRKLGIYT